MSCCSSCKSGGTCTGTAAASHPAPSPAISYSTAAGAYQQCLALAGGGSVCISRSAQPGYARICVTDATGYELCRELPLPIPALAYGA